MNRREGNAATKDLQSSVVELGAVAMYCDFYDEECQDGCSSADACSGLARVAEDGALQSGHCALNGAACPMPGNLVGLGNRIVAI